MLGDLGLFHVQRKELTYRHFRLGPSSVPAFCPILRRLVGLEGFTGINAHMNPRILAVLKYSVMATSPSIAADFPGSPGTYILLPRSELIDYIGAPECFYDTPNYQEGGRKT